MSFNKEDLKKTKIWCQQVIKLIDEVEAERVAGFISLFGDDTNHEYYTAPASRKTGELRRRSMDLTRALADLRR